MTRFNTKCSFQFTLLNLVMASSSSVQFKCAIKSTISLEMKCPQLRKPEMNAARNQNSIGERMERKPWEKPGSVNIEWPVPLQPDEPVVCSNYRKIWLNNSFKKRSQAYTQIKHSANCILDRSVQILRKTRWAWALYWGLKSRSWLETHRP